MALETSKEFIAPPVTLEQSRRFYHYFRGIYEKRLFSDAELSRIRGWVRGLGYARDFVPSMVELIFARGSTNMLEVQDASIQPFKPEDDVTPGSWTSTNMTLFVAIDGSQLLERQGIPDYASILLRSKTVRETIENAQDIEELIDEGYLPLNALLIHFYGQIPLSPIATGIVGAVELLARAHTITTSNNNIPYYYIGGDMVYVLNKPRRLVDVIYALLRQTTPIICEPYPTKEEIVTYLKSTERQVPMYITYYNEEGILFEAGISITDNIDTTQVILSNNILQCNIQPHIDKPQEENTVRVYPDLATNIFLRRLQCGPQQEDTTSGYIDILLQELTDFLDEGTTLGAMKALLAISIADSDITEEVVRYKLLYCNKPVKILPVADKNNIYQLVVAFIATQRSKLEEF